MRNYLPFLLSLLLLTSCFKGEEENIEDSANQFQAKIDGRDFQLSQVKICSFPNPCYTEGGFNIYYFDNWLNFRVKDVKNDYTFHIDLFVPDQKMQVNLSNDIQLSMEQHPQDNWGSITLTTGEYVWVELESGGGIQTKLTYRIWEGEIHVNEFNPETYTFSGSFSGIFQLEKGGQTDRNGDYHPYIYPDRLVESMEIKSGYFEITEPK